MLIITQIASANASPDTLVKVEPSTSIADVGQTFTVNITITDVQNLFGLEVTLDWDSSILQMVGADVWLGIESNLGGVLHEPVWENETKEGGRYMLYGTSVYRETPSFNGSGTIASVTFNVTNVESCKLNLETKLVNKPPPGGVASPITHATIDGFFGPIHIFVSPNLVAIDENINISGFITPAQANVEVTILYRREGETDWTTLSTVGTNEQGNYLYVWQPQEGGKYEIKATAVIEGTTETSYLVFVTVEAPEQPTYPYIVIIIVIVIIVIIVAIAVYHKRIKS